MYTHLENMPFVFIYTGDKVGTNEEQISTWKGK